jgi:hypothetical protein
VVRAQGFQGDIFMHDGWSYTYPGVWDGFMPPPQYQNVLFVDLCMWL